MELNISDVVFSLVVLLATLLLYCIWMAFDSLWRTPRRVTRFLESQGIRCMPRHFFYGNLLEFGELIKEVRSRPMPHISHNIVPHVLPHYHQWVQKYGYKFVFWQGAQPTMFVTDIEDAKEIMATKVPHFPRPDIRLDTIDLIGNGLGVLNGETWALHRRIVSPAFFVEKLKAMVPTMVACTTEMVKGWDSLIEEGQEIDVTREFKIVTADIIAHTGFGSNYVEAKQVFEMQQEQFKLVEKISRTLYIPGARFIPTAFNRRCWKVTKDINEVLRQMIEKRLEASTSSDMVHANDLLGLMIAANKGEGKQSKETLGIDDIIDECKTFFFAGHETSATMLTWTCLLLAMNPEWQERVREEVQAVVGATDLPTADSVNHLKLLGMVLNEALRLYPPGLILWRKAVSDIQLGKTTITKGTAIILPVIAWHHDERYWGPDANEFRPERFSEGVANACKVVGAFAPFSMGPQHCIGQVYAVLEAKSVLSMILQRYRFRLSPAYKHSPAWMVTLQAQYGVPIIFEKL